MSMWYIINANGILNVIDFILSFLPHAYETEHAAVPCSSTLITHFCYSSICLFTFASSNIFPNSPTNSSFTKAALTSINVSISNSVNSP